MTDTEFAKEVAEKVWGWEKQYDRLFKEDVWVEEQMKKSYGINYPASSLKEEVNSWQGFGRTVEAMADKWWECLLTNVKGESVIFQHPDNKNHPSTKVRIQESTWEATIKATHQAALDAVKEGE